MRESETILRAAKQAGLAVKIHADEFERSGGAMLAAKVGATSADHLLAATNDDFRAMAAAGVVAVLLPTTSLSIGRFARARRMIEMGVTLALGSDWNPGTSMTGNMQLVAHLACELLKLTPDEALAAATLNAAYACGEAARTGSLEPGKRADLVVWSASNVAELMHGFGFNPARLVIRAGRLVYDSSAVKG